jgi:hypothetical protein
LDFSIEDNKGWLSASLSTTSNKVTLNSVDVSKVMDYTQNATYTQSDLVFFKDAIWKCQVTTIEEAPADLDTKSWSMEAPAAQLTLTILNSDRATTNTGAAFSDTLIVNTPKTSAKLEVTFTNGVCVKTILFNNTGDCGLWKIPSAQKRIDLNGKNYRIDKTVTFSANLPY